MKLQSSIFHDEWVACLREHYLYVIRSNDAGTEPSLRTVMRDTGFSDEEIDAIADEARHMPPITLAPEEG